MNLNKTSLSFLSTGELGEVLQKMGHSKQLIKKYLPKKERERLLEPRMSLELPLDLINQGHINPLYKGEKKDLLYEDQKLIVFNKPHRIHSHPLSYDESDNILSYARQLGKKELLKTNLKSYDRGLLHRLDYETSGVLIGVKNDELYRQVRHDFSKFVSKKIYWAVVQGIIFKDFEMVDYLETSGERGARTQGSAQESGRLAKALVTPLETGQQMSLVQVELETGFKHQIRFQLADRGHPILGDQLYGGANASRLYLHSYCYQLSLDKEYTFEAACDFISSEEFL